MILPADVKPQPVLATGMFRVTENFAGPAITLRKLTPLTDVSFNFGADGKLPLADIDALRAGQIVRVMFRAEQMNGHHFIADGGLAPKFAHYTTGGHRAMWMEGDCQVENAAPTGQVYGMLTVSELSGLGISNTEFTVMQVVQLHNSAFNNQFVGAPTRGCTFSMVASGNLQVARLFSESNVQGNPGATEGGGFSLENDMGFRANTLNAWQETTPMVLTCITGPAGTFFGQNEDVRSCPDPGRFPIRVASQARIGFHENSPVPPQLPELNEAMGMSEVATFVWNRALSLRQAAIIRAMLYEAAEIDHRHSHSNAPLILLMTDSIWAGYKGDDLRGWDNRAMLQLPSRVRWANFAVPGQGIMQPIPPPATISGYTLGLVDGWMAQAIRQHKGRVHAVFGSPTNDFPAFSAATAYNQGTLVLIDRLRAIDPTITITLCTATHSTNAAIDVPMGQWSVLARAGQATHGYNLVEVRDDPVMNTPGVNNIYKDGTHLGNDGCDRMDLLIRPTLQAWLTSLGVT